MNIHSPMNEMEITNVDTSNHTMLQNVVSPKSRPRSSYIAQNPMLSQTQLVPDDSHTILTTESSLLLQKQICKISDKFLNFS